VRITKFSRSALTTCETNREVGLSYSKTSLTRVVFFIANYHVTQLKILFWKRRNMKKIMFPSSYPSLIWRCGWRFPKKMLQCYQH